MRGDKKIFDKDLCEQRQDDSDKSEQIERIHKGVYMIIDKDDHRKDYK